MNCSMVQPSVNFISLKGRGGKHAPPSSGINPLFHKTTQLRKKEIMRKKEKKAL